MADWVKEYAHKFWNMKTIVNWQHGFQFRLDLCTRCDFGRTFSIKARQTDLKEIGLDSANWSRYQRAVLRIADKQFLPAVTSEFDVHGPGARWAVGEDYFKGSLYRAHFLLSRIQNTQKAARLRREFKRKTPFLEKLLPLHHWNSKIYEFTWVWPNLISI